MANERDKNKREELKGLVEELFKDSEGVEELRDFIDTLENGKLDILIKDIKNRLKDS